MSWRNSSPKAAAKGAAARPIFEEDSEEEMERLSPYELELLSSSPPQTALSLSPPPSVASHQQNGDALHFSRGGDLATQHLQEATEGGRREAEDDDDDDLLLEGRNPMAANNFQGDDHLETDSLLGGDEEDEEGRRSREVSSGSSGSFDDFGGEIGTRLAELARKSSKKNKRVSWVDLEKGSDSVVFGAVTAVFAAPSRDEYDRSPGHRLRRPRRLQRRQKVMEAIPIDRCQG